MHSKLNNSYSIQSSITNHTYNGNNNTYNDSTQDKYRSSIPQMFYEEDMNIAILQTNPIHNEMGSALALNVEQLKLKRIIFRQRLAIKVFFGVLTSKCLMNCISRGVRVIHISGHGPPEKKLKVEDNHGRLHDITAESIKDAILKSDNELKLVFVSTCYSQNVAQAFCDAGVEHVVAVHSKVKILDEIATRFAISFYEHLIARHCTVAKAFNNSKAELSMSDEIECCCKHEGHTEECVCLMCNIPRCCKIHHSLKSCKQHINIPCCLPDIPHRNCDKFLLLSSTLNNNCIHEEVVFPINDPYIKIGDSMMMISTGPTNVLPPANNTKIVGRAAYLSTFVELLHPDNNCTQIVIMHGLQRSGLSLLGKQIAWFFNRPWYTSLFAGGVWYISLQSCGDPNAFFSYIAGAMKLGNAHRGIYEYQMKSNDVYSYHPYPKEIQSSIHEALDECNDDPICFFDEQSGKQHWIVLFDQQNRSGILPQQIYDEICHTIRHNLPLEVFLELNDEWNEEEYKSDSDEIFPNTEISPHGKYSVRTRKIKYNPPNEERVLDQIKNFECGFEKLFIIDQIDCIDKHKISNLLKKVEKLASEMNNSKVLLICNDKIFETIQKVNQIRVKKNNNTFIAHEVRISCIDTYEAAKLLLNKSRKLFHWDFIRLAQPSTALDISRLEIFNWLARCPSLINLMAVVLRKKVPFYVILASSNACPNEWFAGFEAWANTSIINPFELRDAKNSLLNFLAQISIVKQSYAQQLHSLMESKNDEEYENEFEFKEIMSQNLYHSKINHQKTESESELHLIANIRMVDDNNYNKFGNGNQHEIPQIPILSNVEILHAGSHQMNVKSIIKEKSLDHDIKER